MQPTSPQDYKQLLTAVIKKQIVILGPDITLSKARNVTGITVADDGTVTNVEGSPQEVTQALIDQFVQLSGLIVKKTMEPLLSMSQPTAAPTVAVTPTPTIPTVPPIATPVTPTPAQTPITQPAVQQDQIDHAAQAVIDQALAQPQTTPQTPLQTPVSQPAAPTTPAQPANPPAPAKNPLAA